MNCFQICIFVLIATTLLPRILRLLKLWIAFKFVSLYWSQQLYTWAKELIYSCELLSNLYLCTDRNNNWIICLFLTVVVNCFQICIFVLIATTFHYTHIQFFSLWIAFKFVSLYWSQQRPCTSRPSAGGCELLSNLYLCTDRNNIMRPVQQAEEVVNCFQICIFVLIATTAPLLSVCALWLWIAFKFVSLYWSQQLRLLRVAGRCSCELLSNLYLCTDRNNNSFGSDDRHYVVNCFQICIFVLIATTFSTWAL